MPLKPNKALEAIVGPEKLLYRDASRMVWMYVKRHRLQDQQNKLQVNADTTLQAIVGKAKATTVELTEAVRKALS